MKSIDEQVTAMEALYPNLLLIARKDRMVLWRGHLRPYSKSYAVEIFYETPLFPEVFSIAGVQPLVQIIDPVLERHASYEEGPIPHIYENAKDPDYPFLCLFDPDVPEWTLDDLIAQTTIPWAERWLLNYEFWLATGLWRGGGRHPGYDNAPKSAARTDDGDLKETA